MCNEFQVNMICTFVFPFDWDEQACNMGALMLKHIELKEICGVETWVVEHDASITSLRGEF